MAERRGGVLATRVAYTPLQHAKRKRGILKCSPRPEIEQGGSVGSSAAKIGDESGLALGEGSLQRSEQMAAGSGKFQASRRS